MLYFVFILKFRRSEHFEGAGDISGNSLHTGNYYKLTTFSSVILKLARIINTPCSIYLISITIKGNYFFVDHQISYLNYLV